MLSLAPANLPGSARNKSQRWRSPLALTLPRMNRMRIDSAEKDSRRPQADEKSYGYAKELLGSIQTDRRVHRLGIANTLSGRRALVLFRAPLMEFTATKARHGASPRSGKRRYLRRSPKLSLPSPRAVKNRMPWRKDCSALERAISG